MSPEPFDSRAKFPPAKRWEKGYGDENDFKQISDWKIGYDNFQAECLQNEDIHTLGCMWICFLKKYKGLLQHMKGIRCLEVVSNPAFLEHTFFLFDSSLS